MIINRNKGLIIIINIKESKNSKENYSHRHYSYEDSSINPADLMGFKCRVRIFRETGSSLNDLRGENEELWLD